MTSWTDEQLVKTCLAGSEQAWAALVDKYKNLIYSIPIKYGISREDAGDIFQSVCLRLLSELPGIRDPNCLGAWLIKVTSHKCFHWTRQGWREDKMTVEIENIEYALPLPGPDEALFQIEREQILREALLEISPRCRELMRMLFYQTPAIPYEDVAKHLGLARGSIGFIRMRCLTQLRNHLTERGLL